MKKFFQVLMVLSMVSSSWVHAQYSAKVFLTNGKKVNGVVYHLNDSSIAFITVKEAKSLTPNPKPWSLPVSEIKEIRFRKFGAIWKGAIVGGVLGAGVGAGIGYASYTPCEPKYLFDCLFALDETTSTIFGGMLGLVAGGGLGTLMGSQSQLITLEGDDKIYHQYKEKMKVFLSEVR